MKKLLLVLSLFVLVGCSNDSSNEVTALKKQVEELKEENEKLKKSGQLTSKTEIKTDKTKTEQKDKNTILKKGESWVVDGQWKLTVNNVSATDYRNQFSDKKPEQVVIVDYTYENLGYTSDYQELYIRPKSIIDSSGQMGDSYPITKEVSVKPTPVGATMTGAQEGYGLNVSGGTIKINFTQRANDKNNYSATFEIEVE